jgi:hypothetical protein
MFTKTAIALAIIVSTASGALAATKQRSINPGWDVMSVVLAPTVRDQRADAVTVVEKVIGSRDITAPIVVAQGRCQNGKCY